jgi:hypothetical protein
LATSHSLVFEKPLVEEMKKKIKTKRRSLHGAMIILVV